MKKLFYSIIVTLFFSLSAFAQSEGISFQGLARNAAGEVLVSQKISLRLSILLDTESGAVAYVETRQVTTNPQGIFSLVIGDDTALTNSTIFSSIKWNSAPKFIKVEMDPNGGSSYQSMGTTRLQAVPFAFYAYGVDASNVKGLLPVASGGTGVASILELKTRLGLDNFSNAALDTKVDKVAGKGLSSNDYTTAEKNKLAGITGTNTGDQDLSSYATISQLATKANAADVITSLATKANVADVIISLDTKANASEVTTSLASKVDKEIGKGLSTNDYTTAEKTKLAAITGTNTGQDLSGYATTAQLATKANASDVTTGLAAKANASDVTTSLASKVDKVTGKELSTNDFTTAEKTKLAAITGINTGDQDLSGYATTSQLATKPNASDVTTSLATKEDVSNKSNAALGTSTIFYPTQNAVKTYVDAQILTATIADADATTKGKIQLAGDLTGSATAPAIASGAVTSAKILDATIVNADIATAAAIEDTKLATIATSGKVSNSATTATDANTASTIVARDANGNFTAGTITANLTGNVTGNLTGNLTGNAATATSATSFSGNLSGDVIGTQSATVVGKINGTSLAGLSTGLLKNTTSTGIPSIAVAGTDYLAAVSPGTTGNVLTSNGTTWISSAPANSVSGSAATLTNARTIYGNSFDGSANVTGIIASNFGGTGNGFTKFTGAIGSEKTYTLPNSDAVILTNQTAVSINQGGTGATNKTAAFDALSPMTSSGDIIYGTSGGSGSRLAKGLDNQVLTIVNGLPSWNTPIGVSLPQDANEESLSTLAQTSFTLAHTPVSTSKVKMYINGIRISNSAYSISGTAVTYNAVNNGAYDLAINDRIQFDYQY